MTQSGLFFNIVLLVVYTVLTSMVQCLDTINSRYDIIIWTCQPTFIYFLANYYHYYYFTPSEFFTSMFAGELLMELEWQQVSRTLLSILANLNNSVVCMVLIFPLFPNCSNPLSNSLGTVLSAPPTCSTVFFSSLAKSKYFTLWSDGMGKSTR